MHILVIGSGGREHALCLALAKSPRTKSLFCLPGNGGINKIAQGVALAQDDHAGILRFCQQERIDLVVIGPEAPLVAGLADELAAAGIAVFGCSKAAAQLEGSKDFTKKICDAGNIPTAAYASFTEEAPARAYVEQQGAPIVIKADGLAAGKGVVMAETLQQARDAIRAMFAGEFGAAGKKIVIEEWLMGEEVSLFAVCDGKRAVLVGNAQDHKRVGEGDTGPNTGGMGTYSPTPAITPAQEKEVMRIIIEPTLKVMQDQGMPFKGVLFAGLMMTQKGPKLLEYNVRFGDPETQVILPRLKSDLVELLLAAAKGDISQVKVELSAQTALCVVMAAKGYPGEYRKKTIIRGTDEAAVLDDVTIYHAGTEYDGDTLLSTGGRVLGVTALGNDITEAQVKAYEAVNMIDWPEGFCRRDIGWRAVQKLQPKQVKG